MLSNSQEYRRKPSIMPPLQHAASAVKLVKGSSIPWTGPGFWTGLDSGLDSWIIWLNSAQEHSLKPDVAYYAGAYEGRNYWGADHELVI